MKTWMRWALWGSAGFLVLLLTCAGFIYYQMKSINLVDIQARHRFQVGEMALPDEKTQKPAHIPPVLNRPLDTANSYATKPIKAQDALDAASILLNSGLSLKEVYYLTGQATDKLSVKEKQNIRDLLLSKLTAEEIAALRSITSEYGKNLIILDPGYPIELVGVYDEKERSKIKEELAQRDKSEAFHGKPNSSFLPASSMDTGSNINASPAKDPIDSDPGSMPIETADQTARKAQINQKYTTRITALQASCEARVNRLAAGIAAGIKQAQANKEEISMETLQNTYLHQILSAEEHCDQQFQSIWVAAQKEYLSAGLDTAELGGWQAQYNAAKEQARRKGTALLSAL
ncbi:MAG TPA: hypothetical protein VGE40_10140 [Bacilli bacterium]